MKFKKNLIRIMMLASLSVPVALTSLSAYSSESSDVAAQNQTLCTNSTAYFCEDFSAGNTNNWNLLPETENSFIPDGTFDLVTDQGNTMLRYTAGSNGGVIALVKPEALNKLNSADYYVEAKIRPRANSTTANKQLYLLGRYQDGNNWYAGALNVQNSTSSTQVEIAVMNNGALSRVKQVKVPISQGSAGKLDGDWHQLRLVMKDQTLTVYYDGDEITTTTDSHFTSQGLIGLWTSNKSFEIDDINVGNADDKPASLSIDSEALEYTADAGDDPTTIPVKATTRDGGVDTITVTSGDDSIVKATIVGDQIVLTPLSQGKVTITVTSGSGVSKSIHAVIAAQFEMPTATYAFTNQLKPAAQSTDVYEDTTLSVTFDSQPVKGIGAIRIYDANDDTLVDQINVDIDEDNIGYKNVRTIKTHSVRIVGNEIHITPHAKVLQQGKSYYIVIPESAFTGATLAGKTFAGIGRNSNWIFTTRTTLPDTNKTLLVVDDDGTQADFRSVQGAINFIRKNHDADTPMTILVKTGTYEEPLYVYGQNNLTIMGEGRQNTVITYKNNEQLNSGTNARALFLAKDADMLTLQDLTLKNTTLIGEGHQAEALYFNSEGRLIAYRSNFISEQDTLMLNGWTWFYKAMVAGNVDFIWGYTHASLFENSEIQTLGDSRGGNNGGYILQARVRSENDKGFVFLNSILTRKDSVNGYPVTDDSVYLARSGGCSGCYDNIAFINTWMDDHIRKTGWLDTPAPTPEKASATAGWREYNSMDLFGYPLDISQRLDNSYQMNEEEVADGYLNRRQIFADYNNGEGWTPQPPVDEYYQADWMNWFNIIRL